MRISLIVDAQEVLVKIAIERNREENSKARIS